MPSKIEEINNFLIKVDTTRSISPIVNYMYLRVMSISSFFTMVHGNLSLLCINADGSNITIEYASFEECQNDLQKLIELIK